MAKIIGVQTGWKGKVGNMIFSMWKGVQVAKTMFIPSNPQTAAQQANRGCLGSIVEQFKKIAVTWIRPIWNEFASGSQSGWGNFISRNKLAMGSTFDITDAIFSHGTLEGIVDLAGTYDTATGELIATWDDAVYGNGSADDYLNLVAVDDVSGSVIAWALGVGKRSEETYDLACPPGYVATNVHIFATVTDVTPVSAEISSCSVSQSAACTAPV